MRQRGGDLFAAARFRHGRTSIKRSRAANDKYREPEARIIRPICVRADANRAVSYEKYRSLEQVHRVALIGEPRLPRKIRHRRGVDDDDARARGCGFHDEDRLRGATEPPSSSSRAIRLRAAVCLCQGEPMAETLLSKHRAGPHGVIRERERERERENSARGRERPRDFRKWEERGRGR